jgi:methyl-accepting chemotaxis protein
MWVSTMFRKLPLGLKLTLGSGLALIGTLILCWAAVNSFRGIGANLHYISDVAEPRVRVLLEVESHLNNIHTKALRTSLWEAAGVSQTQIDTLVTAIQADIKNLEKITQENADILNADAAMLTAMTNYRKIILDALDLASDPPVASGYFKRADQTYSNLIDLIQKASTESRLALSQNIMSASANAQQSLTTFLILTAGILLSVVVINAFVSRLVFRGLRDAVDQIHSIEQGNLHIDVCNRDLSDLIGDVARSVESLRLQLLEAYMLRQHQEQLEQSQIQERRQSQLAVADLFERQVSAIVVQVLHATKNLEALARDLSQMAHATSLSTEDIVRAAEDTSSNVMRVASATEELSSSVSEISRQVDESVRYADQAVLKSTQSSDGVRAVITSAERINDMTTLIDNVAGKTNLLALNATIEAARAGEHGRGFAIVAQEVKNLATQTAAATSDIATHIQNMNGSTHHAHMLMQGVSESIADINKIAVQIATNLQEQNLATKEIAQSMSYAATAADKIAKTTTDVNDIAHKSSKAAENVLTSTSLLHEQASQLSAEIASFLESVRAA